MHIAKCRHIAIFLPSCAAAKQARVRAIAIALTVQHHHRRFGYAMRYAQTQGFAGGGGAHGQTVFAFKCAAKRGGRGVVSGLVGVIGNGVAVLIVGGGCAVGVGVGGGLWGAWANAAVVWRVGGVVVRASCQCAGCQKCGD